MYSDESTIDDSDSLLHVDVTTRGTTQVISARGEIDALTAAQLQHTLEQVQALIERAAPGTAPVIDLSKVGFLGSAGLSVLQAAAQAAKPESLRVVASAPARRVIEVTGMNQLLDLYDDLDAALPL